MSLFLYKIFFDAKFYRTLDVAKATMIIRNGNPKKDIVGLSEPSKMNCHAWSIPAKYCKTGMELRDDPENSCHVCYACQGHYLIGRTTKSALEERYEAWQTQEHWVEAMTYLIKALSNDRFRWFDSGDIQDMHMMAQITEIATRTSRTKHWLPTQEHEMVAAFIKAGYIIPENVTIRLSTRKINGEPPSQLAQELMSYPNVKGFIGTSRVVKADEWITSDDACPSSLQGNNCGICTNCWNETPNIDYKKH